MIKKLIYIFLFLPLASFGQWNFFWNHPYEGWNVCNGVYNTRIKPEAIDFENDDIEFSPDGVYMFIQGGWNKKSYIDRYTLSPRWDISSSTDGLSQNIDYQSWDNDITGIFFKPDGSKLFIVGNQNDSIIQFGLSPAWSLSSPTRESGLYVGDKEMVPRDIYINADGDRMYLVGTINAYVFQYNLSTSWNVSTSVYNQSYNVNNQEALPYGIAFNTAGSQMYISGGSDSIYQYKLSTAWDISTASYDCALYCGNQYEPTGIAFKQFGEKLYTTGEDSVFQYHLWPIETKEIDLKENLISVWELDETSGTTAYDSYGSYDFTHSNVTINQTGKSGKAADYNGTNSQTYKPTSDNIVPTDNFTIAAWVKREGNSGSTSNMGAVMGKYYGGSGRQYILAIYDSDHGTYPNQGRLLYYDTNNSQINVRVNVGSDIWTDNWVHIIGIKEGDELSIYVNNGKWSNSATGGNGTMSSDTIYCKDQIGSVTHSASTPDFVFNGLIDQVGLWSECLNSDKRSALYNSGNGKAYSEW